MKVLFLDFDGVLNSNAYHRVAPPTDEQQVLLSSKRIDPAAVERLNGVLEATGAKVVISSTWRVRLDRAELQELLEERGFRGEVVGVTPRIHGVPRGSEIRAWLDANTAEAFAIVDDHDDMGDLADHLVRTDTEIGLIDDDCKRLRHLLGQT